MILLNDTLRKLIAIALIIAAFFLVQIWLGGFVNAAEDNTTGIDVIGALHGIADTVLGTPAQNQTLPLVPYIYQGDKVYLNTTIDISGVAPPYPYLAYWDGVDMYDSPPSYNFSLPDTKKGYYQFWVDPEIFGQRLGRWYKYNGEFEPQGNNLAFVVVPYDFYNYTIRYPNGTLVNSSEIIEAVYEDKPPIKEASLLPDRHEADYIVAKGDPIVWPDGGYRLWVFGRVNGIYDYAGSTIPAADVETLESGRYTLAVHVPGGNTVFEARYANNTLYPAFYGKSAVPVFGLTPPLVLERLKTMLADTDDSLYEYMMEVDTPYITIRQADETVRDGLDYLDVRGYTNVANGTEITVTLDSKYMKGFKGTGTAVRTSPGNLSYYRVYVPFNWDELAADARNHTLIAKTAIGGSVEKDFKVSLLPPDSFKPNASIKYIEDRNPFVPTPTPVVVEKVVTRTVERIVTVEVTPPDEQVYAQQKKAVDDKWWETIVVVGQLFGLLVVVAILLSLGWYIRSLYHRKKECEQDEKWKL